MSAHRKSTAILLFARTAAEESKHKSLINKSRFNSQLNKQLLHQTKKIVSNSSLPYYHANESNQVGSSFGEKLSNAIESVFDKGYSNVIVVGSDCPTLSVKDIIRSKSLVENGKLVFGPDIRGGTYLIGLNRGSFDKETFSKLSWNTSRILDQLVQFAKDSAFLLKGKLDLNTIVDVQACAKVSLKFRLILQQLFGVEIIIFFIHSLISVNYHRNLLRRGPPLLV